MAHPSNTQRKRHAAELIASGDTATADSLIDAGIAQSPDDGRWWQLRGMSAFRSGRSSAAMAALETAAALQPLQFDAQWALAECYAAAGYHRAALAIFHHLQDDERLSDELLAPLARGLATCGDAAKALAVCRRAARRFPECDGPLRGMAHYMGRLGHPPERIHAVMQKAWRLRPEWPPYRLSIALLLHRMDRLAEAYDWASELTPEFIATLKCRRCLLRLLAVYAWADDRPLHEACIAALPPADASDRADRRREEPS